MRLGRSVVLCGLLLAATIAVTGYAQSQNPAQTGQPPTGAPAAAAGQPQRRGPSPEALAVAGTRPAPTKAEYETLEDGTVELGPLGQRRSARRHQHDHAGQAQAGRQPGQGRRHRVARRRREHRAERRQRPALRARDDVGRTRGRRRQADGVVPRLRSHAHRRASRIASSTARCGTASRTKK